MSFRPSILLAVPRVFENIAAAASQRAEAGGRQRLFAAGRATAISGGAPLDAEWAHFFRGEGVTILEGWGMTETTGPATMNAPGAQRIGSVGLPLPGCAVRIAPGGEIEVHGPGVFSGYWQDLRKHWLIGECVVVGDQRPYPPALVTLDGAAFARWKQRLGKPPAASVCDLRGDPDLNAVVQDAVDGANGTLSLAEAIKRFRILDACFAVGAELTPMRKVRRDYVLAKYASDIRALYR